MLAARADIASANRAGLIGTLIYKRKQFVVNNGKPNGSFGTVVARDYEIKQMEDFKKT